MRRIGGRKPRSSIWSASSSTRISVPAKLETAAAEVVEQTARRGDQHVDAARQGLDLGRMADAAEYDRDGETDMAAVGAEAFRDLRWPARAWARAPARGSPCASRCGFLAARRWMIGSANAAVLPVPVCAMPSRSRPVSTMGIALAWMGVGVT